MERSAESSMDSQPVGGGLPTKSTSALRSSELRFQRGAALAALAALVVSGPKGLSHVSSLGALAGSVRRRTGEALNPFKCAPSSTASFAVVITERLFPTGINTTPLLF